jgi:hypothetical protein
MTVLFENEDLLALDKPPGVSLATSSRADKSASAAVERLLLSCKEVARADLLLVHRLDLPTTGVVLLAKCPAAHRALSRALQSGGARKTYRALAWGHPVPAGGGWTEPLGRDPKDGRKMKARADGKRAITRYRTLRRLPRSRTSSSPGDREDAPDPRTRRDARAPARGRRSYGGATLARRARRPIAPRALGGGPDAPPRRADRDPELGLDISAPLPEDYAETLAILGGL